MHVALLIRVQFVRFTKTSFDGHCYPSTHKDAGEEGYKAPLLLLLLLCCQ